MISLEIEALPIDLSVCKVEDYSCVDLEQPFCFTGCTDQEKSLVCPTVGVPANCISREDGWKAFRIVGCLDFSLVGILSRITGILAENEIGIFAISTFDTDYVLVKKENFLRALDLLKEAGYGEQ